MRILVCGGRTYNNRELLYGVLDSQLRLFLKPLSLSEKIYNPFYIIQGGANGADKLAKEWAGSRGCTVENHPANWDKYGKAAGFIRNQQMLDEGKPDLVIAFKGGNGAADMIKRSKRAGIEIIEVNNEIL